MTYFKFCSEPASVYMLLLCAYTACSVGLQSNPCRAVSLLSFSHNASSCLYRVKSLTYTRDRLPRYISDTLGFFATSASARSHGRARCACDGFGGWDDMWH